MLIHQEHYGNEQNFSCDAGFILEEKKIFDACHLILIQTKLNILSRGLRCISLRSKIYYREGNWKSKDKYIIFRLIGMY